ncbi:VOC family protein [Vandammella animalimorsus]|nr:VOC family protein [Vandammella animalimorsus]
MSAAGETAAATTAAAQARLDHLVVMADTLEQGAAWCQATLGIAPGPGGAHPLFGTHNRLLSIATQAGPFAQAYLEIIAIDPAASPAATTDGRARRRWFDMDEAALRAQVRAQGPRLIHWVARVPDLARACAALAAQGIERGDILQASRQTPRGLLQWQIAVRPDGQRLFDGCLPTLIQWGQAHPSDALPDSGLALHSLHLQHPQAEALRAALKALGLSGQLQLSAGPARLSAQLHTPRGLVTVA